MSESLDQLAVSTLKALSMDAVQAAKSGHPGTPMALAPLGHLLYSRVMRYDPARPDWADRDRFVLSCGHASMLTYGLLHLHGFDLSLDDIKAFRQWGSKTPGHPEYRHTAGVETTTGPLGQGVANAVGFAMAERQLAQRFNRDGHEIVDHHTYVIASDGDLMEGVSAEASSLAGTLGLGKLIVYWDDNRITIDGDTDLSFKENVVQRYAAYGWHTLEVEDGADIEALHAATKAAQAETKRPTFIRVRTIIGDPAPTKKNTASAHGAPLGEDEISATKKIMGWPDQAFHVPAEMSDVQEASRRRGAEVRAAWERRFEAYAAAHPELAKAFTSAMSGELPAGWDADLPTFEPNEKGPASRQSGQTVLNSFCEKIDGLVGGSADLTGSNGAWQKGAGVFGLDEGLVKNVHFGVREHGMASICNGMALHGGIWPYCATFLIFCEYMRPAMRMAAMMNLPVRYVFTHDSIGLGEDGPTHQPIEQLAALRGVPNLVVLRPADANEVREAWRVAMQRPGPVALAMTRQSLPTVDRSVYGAAEGVAKGGYILKDAKGGAPKLILMATGSEVAPTLAAAEALEAEGVPTRCVSMPSWELFLEQDARYQDEVLPRAVTHRVVVEAGRRMGWERFAGPDAAYVTLEDFGASAPADELFERFGFTAANIQAVARGLLG